MTSTHVRLVSLRRTLPLALAALAVTTGVPLTGAPEGRTVSTQSAIVSSDFAFSLIDVPGSTSTVARGLNNLGHVVGSYVDAGGHTHGFILKNGVFSTIDGPQSAWTIATGINNAGRIVGAYGTGGAKGNHGFVLNRGVLTTIDVPQSADTIANGVNNAGQIVGSFMGTDEVRHGFLMTFGTFTTLDAPDAPSTIAEGINDAGQIVGRSETSATSVGFLLTEGTYSRIETIPGVYSNARGVNSQGDIVGQEGEPGTAVQGFLRTGGSYAIVNSPSSARAWNIQGINDLGLIVGEVTTDTGTHGYLGRPTSNGVSTTDDTRLPVAESPRASLDPREEPVAVGPVAPINPGLPLPNKSAGTIRWVTAIGSQATATFTARAQGGLTSGEVLVSNHDGVSFTGTVRCYHQSSPQAAWFSGTIDQSEGQNVAGNAQGTSTFIMSVRTADPRSQNSGRVTLVRGLKPFDCASFHDGRQPVIAGTVVMALQ